MENTKYEESAAENNIKYLEGASFLNDYKPKIQGNVQYAFNNEQYFCHNY